MDKKILIINSAAWDCRTFKIVLKRWLDLGSQLILWTENDSLVKFADQERLPRQAWQSTRNYRLSFGVRLRSWLLQLRLVKQNWPKSFDAVILINWPEKLLFSRLIIRLGIRLIWLEEGVVDYYKLKPSWQTRLKELSHSAKILAINQKVSQELTDFGLAGDALRLIPYCSLPGLMQADMFNNLAHHFKLRRGYFTIGAKVDWTDLGLAEALVKALKLCLEVSPYFQLILLGDGPVREQVKWLVKRWQLETYVWIVGEQASDEKWFEGFQALVLASKRPNWDDLTLGATAISKELILMAESGTIAEDLLESSLGQALELLDAPSLSQLWLRLSQDEAFKKELVIRSKAFNKNLISLETLADKLLAII